MGNLNRLKEQIFATDNSACFIERERILQRLETEMAEYIAPDRYARILATVLTEVSTPVDEADYFVGRVVEARPNEGMGFSPEKPLPSRLLVSTGHMSPDYERLLRLGLKGILEEICYTAQQQGDEESLSFAHNAGIVVEAIRDYALRYADAAEACGKHEAARALRVVPYEPAYDFYSALQGIWIIHMIASCYVGSRDYAFGRFDKYMLPYYEAALADGASPAALCELLAGFLIKTNEICGRATHNHLCKPVPSQASKQYVNIGGKAPNAFSNAVLEAAKLSAMAQPQIVVLLKPDADERFTRNTFEALSVLTDKMNIYHYDLIAQALKDKGVDPEVAEDFTFSACCTLDLNYHSFRREMWVPAPHLLLRAMEATDHATLQSLTDTFKELLRETMQAFADGMMAGVDIETQRKAFVLDGLLLSDSAARCRYACDGKARYDVLNLFCVGIATVGDSLMVIDRLVFREKRYTYAEFAAIVKSDFENNEALRSEILQYTRFGNDSAADDYAAMAGNLFLDAVDALELKENVYAVGGFYSLVQEHCMRFGLGATPDGRRNDAPFSENQSPTYGADKNGLTALLKSVAKLPFDRAITGGLNLTFSQYLPPAILQALVVSYFTMGGFHVGISVVDPETLEDAIEHPENHPALTVRLYGFSEYFISLPDWQQQAILDRTRYVV